MRAAACVMTPVTTWRNRRFQTRRTRAPRVLRLHDARQCRGRACAARAGAEASRSTATSSWSREPIPRGHKLALQPLERRRRRAQVRLADRPDARGRSPPAAMSTSTISRPLLSGVEGYGYEPLRRRAAAGGPGDPLPRLSARRRPGRHAQRDLDPADGRLRRAHRRADRRASPMPAMPGRSTASTPSRHPHGCSQLGDDLAGTRSLLAALACHPNAGGVLIVGLGCESNQLDALLAGDPGAAARPGADAEGAGGGGRDRGRPGRGRRAGGARGAGAARAGAARRAGDRPQMRRLGRLFGPHRQPAGRADLRPRGRRGRHRRS